MLTVKIKDVSFKSPIMVASGTFGYGNEVKDLVDISKIGCIITKSVTLNPREGNPPPRIHETSSGMLNSIGPLNTTHKKSFKSKTHQNIIGNVEL